MEPQIRLALSGGGVRAAVFHAGVLRWFAQHGLLEKVERISSVSGGSLFVGLVFHLSGYRWPTSEQYLKMVFPEVKKLLTTRSLQGDALRRLLLNPINWRFLLSRANVVAISIERLWGVTGSLGDLPVSPEWAINATTGENGRRFRFKGASIGDYETGYASTPRFKLASAMAVSAAFPGGIGPLEFDTTRYNWSKRASWNSTASPQSTVPPFGKLNLYDGGVYDNLGLEPFFDLGQQSLKDASDAGSMLLVVSDAGAPFVRRPIPGVLSVGRLKRVADIAFEQARALRVRSFMGFLQKNPSSGMYLRIGTDAALQLQELEDREKVESLSWLGSSDVLAASSYATTLRRMKPEAFDLLARHGFETAHCSALLARPFDSHPRMLPLG
jgi:NTE family protein